MYSRFIIHVIKYTRRIFVIIKKINIDIIGKQILRYTILSENS